MSDETVTHAVLGDWDDGRRCESVVARDTGFGERRWFGRLGRQRGDESVERRALSRVLGTAAGVANRTRRGALVRVFGTAMDGADRSY